MKLVESTSTLESSRRNQAVFQLVIMHRYHAYISIVVVAEETERVEGHESNTDCGVSWMLVGLERDSIYRYRVQDHRSVPW